MMVRVGTLTALETIPILGSLKPIKLIKRLDYFALGTTFHSFLPQFLTYGIDHYTGLAVPQQELKEYVKPLQTTCSMGLPKE